MIANTHNNDFDKWKDARRNFMSRSRMYVIIIIIPSVISALTPIYSLGYNFLIIFSSFFFVLFYMDIIHSEHLSNSKLHELLNCDRTEGTYNGEVNSYFVANVRRKVATNPLSRLFSLRYGFPFIFVLCIAIGNTFPRAVSEYWSVQCELCSKDSRCLKTITYCTRAIYYDPENADAYNSRAKALWKARLWLRALQDSAKASELRKAEK
jgi:hypothetical protein